MFFIIYCRLLFFLWAFNNANPHKEFWLLGFLLNVDHDPHLDSGFLVIANLIEIGLNIIGQPTYGLYVLKPYCGSAVVSKRIRIRIQGFEVEKIFIFFIKNFIHYFKPRNLFSFCGFFCPAGSRFITSILSIRLSRLQYAVILIFPA
jgi:hypothetical protein